MLATAGQMVDHQGIDSPGGQIALFSMSPSGGDVVEDPGDLGRREVGIDHQTRVPGDPLAMRSEPVAGLSGPAVLPYDSWRDRAARLSLPYNCCFSLIGESDGCDPVCLHSRVEQGPC